MAPVEVCDQFLCRAYYALGQLVSEQSKALKVSEMQPAVPLIAAAPSLTLCLHCRASPSSTAP